MPLNLASPGILVREVDLTVGRVEPTSDKFAGIVAPFEKGPIDVPTLIENEKDLVEIFGVPHANDKHYESWFVASSYLSYGGSLRVIRSNDANLTNSCVGASSTIKIRSIDDYYDLGYGENTIPNITFCAKNPGSWANDLVVAIIDSKADQILTGINTEGVSTESFNTVVSKTGNVGVTTTIITGINTSSITIGLEIEPVTGVIASGTTVVGFTTEVGQVEISDSSLNTGSVSSLPLNFGNTETTVVAEPIQVGYGITQSVFGRVTAGAGSTSILTGYLQGIVTEVGEGRILVKVLHHVDGSGTLSNVDYQENGVFSFSNTGSVAIHTNGNSNPAIGTTTYTSTLDWFSQQEITLPSSKVTLDWDRVANRPSTTSYGAARNARFDEIHVLVVDDKGEITGNAGTILEKHFGLSKASNAEFSFGSPSYWRRYLASNSAYIFGGGQPADIVVTAYSTPETYTLDDDSDWDQPAENTNFSAIGNQVYVLGNGKNYDGLSNITNDGALTSQIGDLSDGYRIFESTDDVKVDFLLMGSVAYEKEQAQALAKTLLAVSSERKDSLAFISPYRGAMIVDSGNGSAVISSPETITQNIIGYYSAIDSTSYGVFDSGYKYMYDKFSDTFRYIPLNGDIAGTCARTDIDFFPWFSPAGTTRGVILNTVKLAFNPTRSQRDRLYSNRVNPVIFSPGAGFVLFGDKTALEKSSAFDRINVRRLFIYLENAISEAAKDQLFEFNDSITRTNFVNTVEPFLRDVQSKRGIFDFRVICDETNNTASVIDNNEFIADIYIKPTRSINFIGLTFVATRTGVSFEEVIGTF